MKKSIIITCLGTLFFAGAAFAQPVSDRAVVPVAVTLNQILRLHVTNGGNIEFVFNTIEQYKSGIANSAFYNTDVNVASSTAWGMNFGAEDATLMGTDQDNQNAVPQNTMPLNNVGYMITSTGLIAINSVGGPTGLGDDSDLAFNGLGQFGVTASQNPLMGGGGPSGLGTGPNAGDAEDNAFTINWECGNSLGTGAGNATNAGTILSQNLKPDRYVTNVLLDIFADQ